MRKLRYALAFFLLLLLQLLLLSSLFLLYSVRFEIHIISAPNKSKMSDLPHAMSAHAVSECEPIKLNCKIGNMIRPVFLCFILSHFISLF